MDWNALLIIYSKELAVALKWVLILLVFGKLAGKAIDFWLTDFEKIKKEQKP